MVASVNRLVVNFLETAELRARRQALTRVAFWQENAGHVVTANGCPLLSGAGSVSHARMEQEVGTLYVDHDQRRKTQEAQAADIQDEAELKALKREVRNGKGKPT